MLISMLPCRLFFSYPSWCSFINLMRMLMLEHEQPETHEDWITWGTHFMSRVSCRPKIRFFQLCLKSQTIWFNADTWNWFFKEKKCTLLEKQTPPDEHLWHIFVVRKAKLEHRTKKQGKTKQQNNFLFTSMHFQQKSFENIVDFCIDRVNVTLNTKGKIGLCWWSWDAVAPHKAVWFWNTGLSKTDFCAEQHQLQLLHGTTSLVVTLQEPALTSQVGSSQLLKHVIIISFWHDNSWSNCMVTDEIQVNGELSAKVKPATFCKKMSSVWIFVLHAFESFCVTSETWAHGFTKHWEPIEKEVELMCFAGPWQKAASCSCQLLLQTAEDDFLRSHKQHFNQPKPICGLKNMIRRKRVKLTTTKTETFWSPTHILFPCPVEQASTHMLHNPPFSLLLHNKLFKNTPCKWMRLSIFCCSEAFWHFKHLQLHVWVKWNWSFHFLHVFHDKHHFLFFSCFGIPISQIGHCIEQPSHWLIIANKMTQARMTSKTSASWSAKQSLFAHKRLSEITTISETITNPPLNKICMQNFAKFQFSTSQMTLLTTKTGSSAECFCIWTFCQRQVQFSMSFTRFICNAGMQQQFCSVNRFIVLGEKFASQAKHFATQFPNQWTPIPQIQSKWITSSTIWWENPSSQTFALLKLCPVRQRNNNNSEMIHVQSTLSDEVQQQNPHAVHAHTCPDSMACKANHSQCGWGNQWWKRQPRTCTVVTVVNVRLADVQLETLWGPTKEIISCYHSLRNNSNNSPQSVILCYLVWVKSNAEKSSWKWMSISLC